MRVTPQPLIEGPLENPRALQRELWVRDPDGYVVVLASRSAWDEDAPDPVP